MQITELDQYNLADAVKFHRRLNPRIWGRDEHLLPEVRNKLLDIAADFQEFLGVEDLDVQDITVSGSNAAYSYTKNSDIDLHLVVTMPADPVYQELFNAKKYQYNDEHNIKIGGADVELYVQPADQAHHSQGIYSVKNSNWISVPKRKRARIDDACVRDKVADLDARIHSAIKSQNLEHVTILWDKIKTMRKSGLEQHGEFGCENLAFKMLRNSGCIGALKTAKTELEDRELSLREADKPQQRFRYGFSEGMQSQPYSTSDGVAASTKQFLENSDVDDSIVQDFIQHVTAELGIDPMPEIVLHTNPEWSEHTHSFGRYDPESHTLNVSMPNRHVLDVLRTVAHELVHCSQHQQHGELPDDAGETGSQWENDANARAGIIMRDWANTHPEHFAHEPLEENASGYIPKNKKEAKMPQYAMALSVDIKPGEVGRQANKLALKTGRNGEPGLLQPDAQNLLREFTEFVTEQENLFEISMSPTSLKKLSAQTGAMAGMEFEMIVPGVKGEDQDQEPDYDYDERARSIDDICNFFYDGDFNGRRQIDDLRTRLRDSYEQWAEEQVDNDWADQGIDYLYQYVKNNVDDDVIIEALGLEPDEEGNEPTVGREQWAEYAQRSWEENSDVYDEALQEFRDEWFNDDDHEESWLDSEGLDYMSNVESEYGGLVTWPHWSDPNAGETDVEQVADNFSAAIGRKVNWSRNYHGGKREPNAYVVEPDGSLDPNDDDDAGLEFVSPPLPIEELLSDLNTVKAWADKTGCYTNDSTGLHINVSVPGWSGDYNKLDYVKLALLLGDEYVLDAFGRAGNTYAKSAMGKIRSIIKQNPAKAEEMLTKMKSGMDQLASKAIHSGVTEKYTSINTKTGYIEFRSPGGDWLDENFDKIENTLRRFTVALSAAVDPEAYRQEYLKKLYKLLDVSSEKDPLSYFAKYSAGELPKAALKSFVRQARLEREVKRGKETGPMWWRVYKEGKSARNGAVIEVVASSEKEAKDKAAKEWGVFSDEYKQVMDAEPLRPYKEETKSQQGNWGIWMRDANRFSRAPDQPDNSVLRRFPSREAAEQFIAQAQQNNPNIRSDIEVREIEPGLPGRSTNQLSQTDIENRLGWPDQTGDANYEVVDRQTMQPVFKFVANTADDASRKYTQIMDAMGLPDTTENYGWRAIGDASAPEGTGRPNDPTGRYAIVARNDTAAYGRRGGPAPYYYFRFNMGNPEEQRHGRYVLMAWAARNNVNSSDYMVVDTEEYADSGTAQDLPNLFPDLPRPQGQFTGEWRILVNGQEVHRFGGIGNVQADANRVAAQWLRDNGQGVSGEGFEVVPVMAESLRESNNLHLRDFVVTISPHALEQCYNRNIDPDQVDDILKNISQAKSSIMGQGPGVPFILHDGQGTALGMRRHPGNRLTLATVYRTSSDFVKGKYPTFKIAAKEVGEGQDRFGNFDPPGPETPPTMPAGTVKVDVSDVYDWYKLGQHISNMKGLGHHDFGQGPPSAILSFGDEDLEHEYIQALKRTGLTTTDIDPVDTNQPPGMPRQKTDPTYNVDENFADGKNPGRKGLSKRVGVNTKASVSDLRKTAKNSSGEKQRMAHWLANMKAGRAKAKKK